MQARINLQGEQVSTRFRAEHAETLPLLQAHLHELRQSLQAVGLEVGNIDCQSGSLAETGRSEPDPLIDEQA
jgi:flagellar hook-length control protein FliK